MSGLVCAFAASIPLDKDECVEWHNYYRKIHQAPDVTWSDSLARDAQSWANYLAARNLFQHASRTGQGENLYRSSRDNAHSCRNAIKLFYSEEKDYNYKRATFSSKVGHFTQLVWIRTTEIGVGKAMTSTGAIILVFRYKPPGNFIGQFAENVKPPTGEAFTQQPSFMSVLALSTASVLAARQLSYSG